MEIWYLLDWYHHRWALNFEPWFMLHKMKHCTTVGSWKCFRKGMTGKMFLFNSKNDSVFNMTRVLNQLLAVLSKINKLSSFQKRCARFRHTHKNRTKFQTMNTLKAFTWKFSHFRKIRAQLSMQTESQTKHTSNQWCSKALLYWNLTKYTHTGTHLYTKLREKGLKEKVWQT